MVRTVFGALAVGAIVVSVSVAPSVFAQGSAGEKLFTEQKCTLCHAIAGKGNAKGPLDEVGSKLTADEIREWISDAKAMTAKTKPTRKPEMKAYALPKGDVDALVAYLSAMKKK